MLLLLLFVFCLVGLLLILLRIKHNQKWEKYLKNVPGPKPLFPFGNMLDFSAGSKAYLPVMKTYLDEFGDTVLVHDGLFSQLLITIDYELSEYLYSSTVEINKSDQYKLLHGWLGDGLLTSSGNKWRSHRKVITPSFHFSILHEFIQIFEDVGTKLVKKISEIKSRESVDVTKLVSLYTLDVICEAAMGVQINALDDDTSIYVKNMKELCTIMVDKIFSAINMKLYPLTRTYYKERKHLKVIHEYIEDVIQERIETKKLEDRNNATNDNRRKKLAFLDLLLEVKIDNKPLSLIDLRDEVNTFMFEGHDTTATAISFCLYTLANHPPIQAKVLEEQRAIFGDDLKNARASYANLNEMKYLEMVIKETLRLYPPVMFIGRKLTKDLEFKGTLYPKDLNIFLLIYYVQLSSEYFEDPEKFNPERFACYDKKMPYAYIPFSAGSRNCIGQKFAMLEMTSTLSKLVRHFELVPATPTHRLALAAELILVSKTGVKIGIKNRS